MFPKALRYGKHDSVLKFWWREREQIVIVDSMKKLHPTLHNMQFQTNMSSLLDSTAKITWGNDSIVIIGNIVIMHDLLIPNRNSEAQMFSSHDQQTSI